MTPDNGRSREQEPRPAPEPDRHAVARHEGYSTATEPVYGCTAYGCGFLTAELPLVAKHVVANQYDAR